MDYPTCTACDTVLPNNATNDRCYRHGGTVKVYTAPRLTRNTDDGVDALRDSRLTR